MLCCGHVKECLVTEAMNCWLQAASRQLRRVVPAQPQLSSTRWKHISGKTLSYQCLLKCPLPHTQKNSLDTDIQMELRVTHRHLYKQGIAGNCLARFGQCRLHWEMGKGPPTVQSAGMARLAARWAGPPKSPAASVTMTTPGVCTALAPINVYSASSQYVCGYWQTAEKSGIRRHR